MDILTSRRHQLQTLFQTKTSCPNVYYVSGPNKIIMSYPCIRYEPDDIYSTKADDINYLKRVRYKVTLITYEPDNPYVEEILSIPFCRFNRFYMADGLIHNVFTLYY